MTTEMQQLTRMREIVDEAVHDDGHCIEMSLEDLYKLGAQIVEALRTDKFLERIKKPSLRQRFDIETNIAPPMRQAITLVHKSGVVIYVAQSAFGPTPPEDALDKVAQALAPLMES